MFEPLTVKLLAGGFLTLPPTNMEMQKGQLTKRKVVFLQGSVHFHVSWWEGCFSAFCCV